MLEFDIPGHGIIKLEHLVLDHNGTLACDGILIPGVKDRLIKIAQDLEVHVLTADTFGLAKSELDGVPCRLSILPKKNQDLGKLEYVKNLGLDRSVCIGNGRNDMLMLKESALGIAVVLDEGAAAQTLLAADIVCTSILSALDLLLNPLRMTATLRR